MGAGASSATTAAPANTGLRKQQQRQIQQQTQPMATQGAAGAANGGARRTAAAAAAAASEAPTENTFVAACVAAGSVESGARVAGRRVFQVRLGPGGGPGVDASKYRGGPVTLLGLDSEGFSLHDNESYRLLKRFFYPQVHSWAHTARRFSFRFLERSNRKVHTYDFDCVQDGDVGGILEELHGHIANILQRRKDKAMPEADFEALKERLAANEESQLDELQAVFQTSYVTCAQGKELLGALSDPWDLANAAVIMYQRTIDATSFRHVLQTVLSDPDDIENIWHRIKQLPKNDRPKIGISKD
mmetsp:Transcript_9825/g.40540  ORF Transcript_9825/g.40540 Transcript_9825/m.40540 type:complete len:302 (-) Transcript_9825:1517-2422(-)|eukprot:PRCOL_00002859-RA